MLLKNLDNKINNFKENKCLNSIFEIYPKNKKFKNIYNHLKKKKYFKSNNIFPSSIYQISCCFSSKITDTLKVNFLHDSLNKNNLINKIGILNFYKKKNNWMCSCFDVLKNKNNFFFKHKK
ncbi:hypothetical protein [Buchnera aphidicola]|uniref:hypothetical protein n=1 Tax=Buchnera aphidicola TaxID=9 RepID=UPI003463E145